MYKTHHDGRRLGKLPKKTDRRTLQMARYLPLKLPTPPASVDHASKLPKDVGMMNNSTLGDCTIAAAGHMVQSWTAYAGGLKTIPDADIVAVYHTISPNDDGAFLLDALNHWRKIGIGFDKIEAFVEVAPADLVQAKLAIEYFGSLYLGMSLPDTNTFGPWDVVNPSWPANPYNGHCVNICAYDDARKMFKAATWGEIVDVSFDWFRKYVDESYAVLNDISIAASGLSPEGFNFAQLSEDLNHIGDPVVDPAPTPTPTPAPTPVPTPTPEPGPVILSPILITGIDNARWTVYLTGVAQTPEHVSQLEAAQHADALRWAHPGAPIEIRHNAVYRVE